MADPSEHKVFIDDLCVNSLTVIGGGGAGGSSIGTPTDLYFGPGTDGNVAALDPTDTIADGFDKLSTLLAQLSPSGPPAVSTLTLTLADTLYSAFVQGSATTRTNVQNNAARKPITNIIPGTAASGVGFGDADTGTLSAIINAGTGPLTNGSIALTTGNDTGVNNFLAIVSDQDYYIGTVGKSGFFNALTATIGGPLSPFAFTAGDTEYSYQLSHSTTGSSAAVTFRQDDAYNSTPAVIAQSVTGTSAPSSSVSGLSVLGPADTVQITFTCTGCVKQFYHITSTGYVEGSAIVTNTSTGHVNGTHKRPVGVDRNSGASPTFVVDALVSENTFINDAIFTAYGRNSAGNTVSSNTPSIALRIDTVSLETSGGGFLNESDRKASGVGEFPVYTGAAFATTSFLYNAPNTEELQLLGGVYQYPPLVDYSGTFPAGGPDYSGLLAGSFQDMRWVTFCPGSIINETNVTITINNPSNTTGGTIDAAWGLQARIPFFEWYVKVDGVTGWLNSNEAFPFTGPPSADGDFALNLATSSRFIRETTFGSTSRTGDVIVRIGIPSSSIKGFTGITMTL